MSTADLVGQTLDGKYSILNEIGRGGMGAVYYAVHLGTKRPVAVKVIVQQFMAHAEFVERFKREAEASGRLHHPNVVDVTDFGIAETPTGRVAYLVMEYLEGCTLGEILKEEKKLSVSWTVDILEQVCLAVSAAHKQGVIHRDLKPDNIWLEPNQRGGYNVKVLDFGIAKLENPSVEYTAELPSSIIPHEKTVPTTYIVPAATDPTEIAPAPQTAETLIQPAPDVIPRPNSSLTLAMDPGNTAQKAPTLKQESFYERSTAEITRIGAIMGTPNYMSPEQCRGERPGFTSDVYSLGVIAYQMLSGRLPFEGEHFSVIANHMQTPAPKLRGRKIPRKVKRVVKASLAKEPLQRPETAEIFASQMRAHSEGVVKIIRRSLGVYVETFSKIIWFSLLIYFPTIILAAITQGLSVAKYLGVFNDSVLPTVYTVSQSLVKHTNLALTMIAETLVMAAVSWTVVQYIDAPFRSYKVWRTLRAVAGKWRAWLWIIPVRVVIALLLQGDFPGFPIPVVFVLSFLDSILFWLLPAVVMMESYAGPSVLMRTWKLTWRTFGTVLGALLFNQVLMIAVSVAVSQTLFNVSLFLTARFLPDVYGLSVEELTELFTGIGLVAMKLVLVFLLPLSGVIAALVYMKARYAAGESLESMFVAFRKAEVLQSNWQKRVRERTVG